MEKEVKQTAFAHNIHASLYNSFSSIHAHPYHIIHRLFDLDIYFNPQVCSPSSDKYLAKTKKLRKGKFFNRLSLYKHFYDMVCT